MNSRLLLSDGVVASTLADDVRSGLTSIPKTVLPKHFYDERGSLLFDAICDTLEYYPTRTEQALLEQIAGEVVRATRPTDLVEIGSGAARKTRTILDAMGAGRYVPIDISEEILIRSANALLADYPWLRVHGIVADYDRPLQRRLPESERRLFAFLGGTLGNFDYPSAVDFLTRVRGAMRSVDSLLLGIDLVKSHAVLHAAYNDAAGITAEFNLNVLRVMNNALGANFDVDAFEHVAYYRSDLEQIEMHLESRRSQIVHIPALNLRVPFGAGERLRTEISRKYSRSGMERMAAAAGLRIHGWFTPKSNYFALVLLEPVDDSSRHRAVNLRGDW